MATKPTAQADAQTSASMARLANNPALHRALNTTPEVLESHAIPEVISGSNSPDQWYHEMLENAIQHEPSENLKALRFFLKEQE